MTSTQCPDITWTVNPDGSLDAITIDRIDALAPEFVDVVHERRGRDHVADLVAGMTRTHLIGLAISIATLATPDPEPHLDLMLAWRAKNQRTKYQMAWKLNPNGTVHQNTLRRILPIAPLFINVVHGEGDCNDIGRLTRGMGTTHLIGLTIVIADLVDDAAPGHAIDSVVWSPPRRPHRPARTPLQTGLRMARSA